MAVVWVPVDEAAVAPEAMDVDTTMDAEKDTVDTTMYPCHTWVEPKWSNTLRQAFQAS